MKVYESEERCTGCNAEIFYADAEHFDPVCMDENGDVHCEECCECGGE